MTRPMAARIAMFCLCLGTASGWAQSGNFPEDDYWASSSDSFEMPNPAERTLLSAAIDGQESPRKSYRQVASADSREVLPPASDAGARCTCGAPACEGVCRDPGRPRKPKHELPGDVDRGDCPPLRYRMSDCQRSGNPHQVHRYAQCSVDENYSAWFVGGGAAFCLGRDRTPSEGTWGLDYSGLWKHTKVWLKYTRGRRQGGEGAYRTDGEPKIVRRAHDLFGLGD